MMIPTNVIRISSQMKSAAGGPLGACLSLNGFLGMLFYIFFSAEKPTATANFIPQQLVHVLKA